MPDPDRRRSEPEIGPQVGREAHRPPVAHPGAGATLVRVDVATTALFVVVAALGTGWPRWFTVPVVVVSGAMFVVGVVAFLWAYALAIGRSRTDAIGMGGLFFLARSAPGRVQRVMLAMWVVQVVVAFAAATVRIFTAVTFTLLAPMFGLGLMGLWAARHGAFPPRVPPGAQDGR